MDKDTETKLVNDHKIPYSFDQSKKIIRWVELAKHSFTDPFFYDTIRTCLRERQDQKETSLEEFLNTKTLSCIPPKAFIFHVSRCGSTLLTQMLTQSPKNIILSEPTIFDDLLLSDIGHDLKKHALTKSLEILGHKRNGTEENLIIKLDCWHLLYVDLIRKIFSDTQIVFLFRKPSEVLRSHRIMRGRQMVPGMLGIRIVTEQIPAYDLEGYAVKVLERLYSIIYEKYADEKDLLLDYSQLPHGLNLFLEKTGLTFNEKEKQQMMSRAKFHSKDSLSPMLTKEPVNYIEDDRISAVNKLYTSLLNKALKGPSKF